MKLREIFFACGVFLFLSLVQIFVITPESVDAQRVTTCNPKCGSCSGSIKGTWTFFRVQRSNTASEGPFTYTFSQSGGTFKNTNQATSTIVGNISGNAITLSRTVAGEEIEGYVDFCQGHLISNNKIVLVCDDRDGIRSTFSGLKS